MMNSQDAYNYDKTEERISLRRKRIDKRNRVLHGENIYEEDQIRDESAIEKQIKDSTWMLERLTVEGNELVSNVCVAGTAREVSRREREARAAEERSQVLAEENESAQKQLDEITNQWDLAMGQCDALELHALMQEQKRRCDALLTQKDNLASRLKAEIADRSAEYEQTLKEQRHELALAADRVDRHVEALKHTQTAQIALLETVTERTWRGQVLAGESKWQGLWEGLEGLQRQRNEEREQLAQNLAQNEDELHEALAERLHETRAQLQNNARELGLQLQALRASCILNAEKMKLNTELLRTRDQEARVMRAAQKRKINKLQEKLRSLHCELKEKKTSSSKQRKILRERVSRLQREEASHVTSVTGTQLKMIAEHAAKRTANLVRRVLTIDETLHAEQLCLPWNPPEEFETRLETLVVSLLQCDPSSLTSSMESCSEALQRASIILSQSAQKEEGDPDLQHVVLTALLESSASFLTPDHPAKKLQQVSQQESTLMDLAACLSALGVETEEDLFALFGTFRSFLRCSGCGQQPFSSSDCERHQPSLTSEDVLQGLSTFTAASAVEVAQTDLQQVVPVVTKATAERKKHIEVPGWDNFEKLLPEHVHDLWPQLNDALTQHLTVLQDRHEINLQVMKLEAQNAELRHLLQAYSASKPRREN